MAIYPEAVWRPLAENTTQQRIVPRAVIFHSAVDSPKAGSLFGFFSRPDVTVEAHFFVRWDGTVEQYVDTEVRADHALAANGFAVGIETEDDGEPDRRPWTVEQLAALTDLGVWLARTHRIPARWMTHPVDTGFGWHAMFNDTNGTSPWSKARGKTCPGRARVPQLAGLLEEIARRAGGEMQVREDDLQTIRQWLDGLAVKLDSIEGRLVGLEKGLSGEDPAAHRKTRLTVRAYVLTVLRELAKIQRKVGVDEVWEDRG